MESGIDIWRLVAGLGLFLFGMHQLELALMQLAGRPFKQFLRRHTAHPVKGVLAGALSTAALQSSSVVSLIVLAFVGTGIISLASAIAIVFGSNLGTTATGWIVATVGFKLDIDEIALPLIAIGGLGVVWAKKGTRRAGFSQLVVGLGLMLLGLEFMKSGAINATAMFDPEALRVYPAAVFLAVGIAVTAIIQSSSATIMITLSALYAGVIPLSSAAATAIGADLGTTITALLGALAGSVLKKRVAVALIIFNVVTDAIAFAFLQPLLRFIEEILGISDPLIALVAFHSLFNLIGLVLFLPAIGMLSRRLNLWFSDRDKTLLRHISAEDRGVTEAALQNLTRETYRLIDQVASLNQLSFGIRKLESFYDSADDRIGVQLFESAPDIDTCYANIKRLEGEILAFAVELQSEPLDADSATRLAQLMSANRDGVHAAKSIRDILGDLDAFRNTVDDTINAYYELFQDAANTFYRSLESLKVAELPALRFEILIELKDCNETQHAKMHSAIFHDFGRDSLDEAAISTLLNVNRELYASNHSLLAALADSLLDKDSATDFDSLPAQG